MTAQELKARIIGAASDIGAADWNACADPQNDPFTRHEFFAALEASGSASARTGWQPCHLVLERGGRIEGLLPAYRKDHSQGEYVFDHAWADALERAGGDYYPKLQASVPFTPVTGRRLLVARHADLRETQAALLRLGIAAAGTLETSSLHITFMTETEWRAAGDAGFLLRTDQQFHWTNPGYARFEDFLATLSSAHRKNLRKERASVLEAGVEFDLLTGAAISEAHWDAFFAFYMDTGGRKWGHPYLTRDFFSRVGAAMADQILLVMARRGGRYIAGALNFIGGETLYGRNWGCSEFVPFLHFEACYYQAIDFAIARGLKKVEAGAQGAHKLLRGYMPAPTYSAHYIAHPGLRRAVGNFLEREREAVAEHMVELAAQGPYRKGRE